MHPLTRRELLRRCSLGFGGIALSGLLASPAFGAESSGKRALKAKAKNVIFCYMSGGVSHVDSFDPKSALAKLNGKPMPVPVQRTVFNNNGNIMGSPWEAKRYGQSGIEMTNLFPQIAACADDLTVVRSMTSKVSEHAQGNYFFHTGFPFMGHPSAGAWLNYGLGSENQNLPGFVVLQSGNAGIPHGGVGLFNNGYLPGQHQASVIKADGALPLANIKPGEGDAAQRRRLGFINEVDQAFAEATREPQVEAAIRNYETAYRMQAAVPEICDLNGESEATKAMYGLDSPDKLTAGYARQALLARRLVEKGVRFVELSCLSGNLGGGNAANPWDHHGAIVKGHSMMAHQVDQPIAALLKDLKQRGLLDSTIVIFSGEFGRTPFSQGSDGRDHNPYGFSLWVAGGGFKPGTVFGATDELGYYAVDKPLTVYDFWATILHQLGIDHEKLTYRFGGRDFRLTDVHGSVVKEIVT
jgi:hypothetical protein